MWVCLGPHTEAGALHSWQKSHRRRRVLLCPCVSLPMMLTLTPAWGGVHQVPPLPTVKLPFIPLILEETHKAV